MPQNPLSRSRCSARPYFVLNLLTRHLKAHLYAATIRHARHQPPRSPRRFARTRTPNESPGLAAAVRCRIPRRASTFAARSRPGSVSFRFSVGYKLRLLRTIYKYFFWNPLRAVGVYRVRFCPFRVVRPAPPVRGVCVTFAGLSCRPARAGAARRNRAFCACFRALFARHVDAARLSQRCTLFALKYERLTLCNILRVSVSERNFCPLAPPSAPYPQEAETLGNRGRWRGH